MPSVPVGLLVALVSLGLFLGMLGFIEIGRRIGLRHIAGRGTGAQAGVGNVDSVIYGLLGLLIGFAFSGAAARFDGRRDLVAKQVIAIHGSWLRIDAMPAQAQPAIRDAFRRFVDALIVQYDEPQIEGNIYAPSPAVEREEHEIWRRSVAVIDTPEGDKLRMLVLPPLAEMFATVERERLGRRMHPPPIIFIMIAITAFAASVFAGYGMATGKTRNWMFIIGVAATVSVEMYIILELELPRLGVVQADSIDAALVELRSEMK
jgi:hypothetical protein